MSFEVGSFEAWQLSPGEFDTLLMLDLAACPGCGHSEQAGIIRGRQDIRYALPDCVKLSAPGNYRYRHTPDSLAANGWPFHLRKSFAE